MKYLVFDIETIPNEEADWKPPEDRTDAFPPIPAHKIVSIGGMLLQGDTNHGYGQGLNKVFWLGNFGTPGDEVSIIKEFLRMHEDENPDLVSFNGRGFDLPVIEHRCMRFGIECSSLYNWNLRYRFKNDGHLDLQDVLSNYGSSGRSKLAHICAALGIPGKMDVDGSKVSDMIKEGRQKEVDSYCLCDVVETAWLLIRYLHMTGDITSTTNYNIIHAIKTAALGANDEMLTKLVGLTNIDRLSLEEQQETIHDEPESEEDTNEDPDIPF